MTAAGILLSSAKRRLKDALLLAISTTVAVMALGTFVSAAVSPTVTEASESNASLASLFTSAAIVTGLFAMLSGWFFAGHYLQGRKKEIATWLLVGMKKRTASLILAAEFAIAAIFAFLAGSGLGLLFSRFFSLLLAALMKEREAIEMSFGLPSLMAAGAACFFQFIMACVNSLVAVSRASLSSLMRAEREAERPPRSSPLLAGLGAILDLGSYGAAIFSRIEAAVFLMLPVLICTIAGTFLCFGALVPGMAASLRRREAGLGAPSLVAAAQIGFRSRRNARLLALTAVLVAVAATACGTVLALNENDSYVLRRVCPHAIELASPDEASINVVNSALAAAGAVDPSPLVAEYLKGRLTRQNGSEYETSVFQRSAWALALERLGEHPGEIEEGFFSVALTNYNVTGKNGAEESTIAVGPRALRLRPYEEDGRPAVSSIFMRNPIIVSDSDYEKLSLKNPEAEKGSVAYWDGLDPDLVRKALPALRAIQPRAPRVRIAVLAEQDSQSGAMLFVGIFLAAVFILSASSLLVFRVIEDSRDDADRYRILSELGASRSVVRKSLILQDLFSFGLPLLFGLAHCAAALVMMHTISDYSNVKPTILVAMAAIPVFAVAAAFAVDRQLASCYIPMDGKGS